MRKTPMAWLVVALFAFVPAAALAGTIPGTGAPGTAPPSVFDEGIAYDLGITVFAGDVILCESTSPTCTTATPTSQWSDVLVFYNPSIGPFIAASTFDATFAYVFSDDNTGGTFGGLANFLANYNGLSSNAVAIYENPNGLTQYNGYQVNSPEVPEPTTVTLLGFGLAGILARGRKKLGLS